MAWRLARSLETLRAEINAAAPNRSKRSDGSIGDAAHRASASDHNPNAAGVVCAIDITHDPDAGADMAEVAEQLRAGGHPALKYLIFNRRIWSRARASKGWRTYRGPNPHTSHLHVSVGVGLDGRSTGPYDDTESWGITTTAGTGEGDMVGLKQGDSGERVKYLQEVLVKAGHSVGRAGIDGDYGPATAKAVLAARKAEGSKQKSGDRVTGAAAKQITSQFIKAHL